MSYTFPENLNSLVFVCSPLRGNLLLNQKKAKYYCKILLNLGYTPIAPHLFYPQFLDPTHKEEDALGFNSGLTLLKRCDKIVIFGDCSIGMQTELDFIKLHNLTIEQVFIRGLSDTVEENDEEFN